MLRLQAVENPADGLVHLRHTRTFVAAAREAMCAYWESDSSGSLRNLLLRIESRRPMRRVKGQVQQNRLPSCRRMKPAASRQNRSVA